MKVFTEECLTLYDEKIKKYIKDNTASIDVVIEPSETNGNLKINGVETVIYTPEEYLVEY